MWICHSSTFRKLFRSSYSVITLELTAVLVIEFEPQKDAMVNDLELSWSRPCARGPHRRHAKPHSPNKAPRHCSASKERIPSLGSWSLSILLPAFAPSKSFRQFVLSWKYLESRPTFIHYLEISEIIDGHSDTCKHSVNLGEIILSKRFEWATLKKQFETLRKCHRLFENSCTFSTWSLNAKWS